MRRYYAGIGSRKAPPEIKRKATLLARELEKMGLILLSGNATGMDQAFASGVERNAVILLPEEDFEERWRLLHPNHTYMVLEDDDKVAWDSVDLFHGAPHKLSPFGRVCMARNYRQIHFYEADVEFVVCWTPEAEIVGGTAQAMKIAMNAEIIIYNMAELEWDEILRRIQFSQMIG